MLEKVAGPLKSVIYSYIMTRSLKY